jgi:D-beta-D-heptose 7-phosphate kinase/D-beta-D-heptose 1-phosphate adenosyltransferase
MQLSMPNFDSAQVLVAGDVMLDRYWYGDTGRVSPEAPVPVVNVRSDDDLPGGAANVALNIAALGAGATLTGIVGNDDNAAVLEGALKAANVYCDFASSDKPTITKLRVLSRHQQLLRMDFEQPFDANDAEQLFTRYKTLLQPMKAVILSDYAKGSLANTQAFIKAARDLGLPVLIDPKGTDFSRYRGATLLTPNLSEFETIVGRCDTEQQLVERGLALLDDLDLDALLVTRGEQGMTLLRKGETELHLPARAREVFDVTGAGDTVISVLAASLAAGSELPQAVALANLAAGLVVRKVGTATVSAPELRRAVQSEQGSERGVVNLDQLLVALDEARAAGERIVMTNGCFDIIHAGHVGYIDQARKLGDRLIVAINSDESVRKLKGPSRPINSVDRRMAVLAGLGSVDWVLSFSEDTPETLLRAIKPDVLVKGGDYAKEEVVGWEIVESYGGKVQALDFLDDCSTTAIVEKIQSHQEG